MTDKLSSELELENSHIFIKNRNRLILQNRKLYKQIFNLQSNVSSLLAKKFQHDFEQTETEQKLLAKHQLQTKQQVSEIKRLKHKIIRLKAENRQFHGQDLRKALDQLTFSKQQKIKYQTERQDLYNKKSRKKQALELDKPIGKQKNAIDVQYKKVKLQNGQYINKITQIQRQIRKYHKIKQLAKTSIPKAIQNPQFQIKNIQTQIYTILESIKNIQKEWKPSIESLSNEYCQMKDIIQRKQIEIQQLQKLQNTCKTRISVMKEETEILSDRQRISQIIISPKKRMEINQKLSEQKKRLIMSNQKPVPTPLLKQIKTNPELIKRPKQNKMKKILESVQKQIQKQQSQTKSQRKWNNTTNQINSKLQATVFSENNQFFMPKQNSVDHEVQKMEQLVNFPVQNKKQNKILQSIGIGTTFYYNQDDQ